MQKQDDDGGSESRVTDRLDAAGETCGFCGSTYDAVYRVPDDVWERIRADATLLCPECADSQARDAGIALYWSAAVDNYPEDALRVERPGATVEWIDTQIKEQTE